MIGVVGEWEVLGMDDSSSNLLDFDSRQAEVRDRIIANLLLLGLPVNKVLMEIEKLGWFGED